MEEYEMEENVGLCIKSISQWLCTVLSNARSGMYSELCVRVLEKAVVVYEVGGYVCVGVEKHT